MFKPKAYFADHTHGRDNNFNLIRMLAAFGVMVSHAYPLSLGPDALEPFEVFLKGDNLGRASVFVFFAISGFFITKSYQFQGSLWSYTRSRLLRIYPALIAMIVIVTTIGGLFLTIDPTYWSQVPGYAYEILTFHRLFFNNWVELPGMFAENPFAYAVNGSLWTLRYEVIGYVGVAAAGLLGLLSRPRLFGLFIAAFVVAALVVPLMTGRTVINGILYLGLPFAFGAAFFVFREKVPVSWLLAIVLCVLCVALRPTMFFIPSFMLALSYVTFLIGFADIPWLKAYNRLGDYSYGFYIYAFPVQQVAGLFGIETPLGNIAFALPVTLTLSVASWHLIEGPALKLKAKHA